MKTKVAFIGPKVIHDSFAQMGEDMDSSWDFQQPVETLDDFQKALETGDKISEDTAIIILFSHLFNDDTAEQFAYDAAYLAPYAAVIVLASNESDPDTNKKNNDKIRAAIQNEQTKLAEKTQGDSEDKQYDVNTPFYFMDYNDPQRTFSEALSQYVRDPLCDKDARENILRVLPDTVVEDLQAHAEDTEDFNENEYDDVEDVDDDFKIPEASKNAQGKVITVTSSKGGSGKSTVSMLLGAYLSKGSAIAANQQMIDKPLKVLIFDFDTRDGQLGFLNGEQNPTIIDIVAGGTPTEETINKGIYHNKSMGVDFIFSAKRPRYAAKIPNEFFAEVIQKLREMYDYIILDTSVNYLDPLLDNVAYPIADKIVFVSDIGISSIFGMMRWIHETTQSDAENHENINPDKIGIVVNKVLGGVNMDLPKIKQAASGIKIYALLPSMPGLITYAANTATLDQVLNQPIINRAIFSLANQLIASEGRKLAEVPSIKD